VSLHDIAWADLPDREEAGTPNLLGAVAFAAAARTLGEIGWHRIVAHESRLLCHAMTGLATLPNVHVHGPTGTEAISSKIGVVPFTVDGIDHGLVAAVLGYEHGISVRSGCFCAQPYVAHLLRLDHAAVRERVQSARNGDTGGAPGLVRISLGLGNDLADIDRVVGALHTIIDGQITGRYRCGQHGEYHPIAP
jgi:selenocysteine lyase/cysteine desulfurase